MCVGVRFGDLSSVALLDTGCRCSVIDHSLVSRLDESYFDLRQPSKASFRTANGSKMRSLGSAKLKFALKDANYKMHFNILKGLSHPVILGVDFFQK